MMLKDLQKEFQKLANPNKAKDCAWFFKTEKGEYGEGDLFLGIVVPEQRKLAKRYSNLSLDDTKELLKSKYHEHRLTSLFILINKYKNADEKLKNEIFNTYLQNTKYINNWDLVDSSAPNIIGNYLLDKDKKILYKLAKSKDLWEKRISILATLEFIRNNQFEDTIKIAEILLNDKHDLIHKAVGWMLREIGNRNLQVEEKFLQIHAKEMPRTMLRYAIEKFSEEKKKRYLGITRK